MAITREDLQAALGARYEVREELGRGGMAVVFAAWDAERGGPVALKVLHPELAATVGGDRFLREAQISARLAHPHIVPVHDSGTAGPYVYYTMAVVEGESLQDRLDREGQLPVEEALEITREVASALDYAHAQGVVHRDIKPGNILLSEGGAVVTDFGIAKAVDDAGERLTETGLAMGTPAYMSPEQGEEGRRLDGRADQYSLACVLYEMLAGHPPFSGSTAQVILSRHAKDPVPSLGTARSRVTGPIESVIAKALEKAPADRFRSAGKLVEALDMAEQGVTPRDVTPVTGTQHYALGLWSELARRRVYQAAASYAVIGWALVEVVETVGPRLGVPDGFNQWFLWSVIAGFPVAVLLSWAFELTPKGLKRTQHVGVTPSTGVTRLRPWHRAAMTGGVLAAGGVGLVLSMGTRPDVDSAGSSVEVNSITADLDPKRVAVLPFANTTGDSDLDYLGSLLQDWTARGAMGIGALEVLPPSIVAEILVSAGLDTNPGVRGLAEAVGTGTVVTGRYHRRADSIVVTPEIIDAGTGLPLMTVQPVAMTWSEDGHPAGVEAVAERVGVALAAWSDSDFISIGPPPPDRETYEFVKRIDDSFVEGDYEGAIDIWETRALVGDTVYLAMSAIAAAYNNAGQKSKWEQLVRRLDQDRETLPPFDRIQLAMRIARLDGDLRLQYEHSRDLYELTETLSPYVSGVAALHINYMGEAAAHFARGLKLPTEWFRAWEPTYAQVANALHSLGEHGAEVQWGRAARRRHPNSPFSLTVLAMALVASGELEEVRALENEALGFPPGHYGFNAGCALRLIGRELLVHGHGSDGAATLSRALDWLEERPDVGCGSGGRVPAYSRAVLAYEAGELQRARRELEQFAARLSEEPVDPEYPLELWVEGYLGRTAARMGDAARAEEAKRRIAAAQENDRADGYLLRAGIAAAQNDVPQSVSLLREAQWKPLVVTPGGGMFRDIRSDVDFMQHAEHPAFAEFMRPRGAAIDVSTILP